LQLQLERPQNNRIQTDRHLSQSNKCRLVDGLLNLRNSTDADKKIIHIRNFDTTLPDPPNLPKIRTRPDPTRG